MLKYQNFLENFLLENLINESALYYVKDFKDRLYKLRLKSKIAQDLIDLEYRDVKPDMTFISLGDEEGTIKFSQMNNILDKVKKYYTDLSDEFNSIEDKNSILTFVDRFLIKIKNTELSQSDLNLLYNDEKTKIKTGSRNQTNLGRLVNKLFPDKYTSKEVEDFVNLFKASVKEKPEFELVRGEEIVKWYNQENYVDRAGELGQSCMRYSRCSSYFGIYTQNPEVCQLLILKEGDKIKGRALVWKIEGLSSTEYFMDRVYTIDDATRVQFINYANEKGWLRKLRNGSGFLEYFLLGDKEIIKNISVKLKNFKFEKYPYMDTFKRLNLKDGTLHNDDETSRSGNYILEDTEGGFVDTSGHWSSYYEEMIPENEAVWSEPLEDWLWEDRIVEVKFGRRQGFYPDDFEDIVYDYWRGWIHEDSAFYSEWYDEYIWEGDATEVVVSFDMLPNGRIRYSYETLSQRDSSIKDSSTLDCYSYLLDKGLNHLEFIDDILLRNKVTGKYYFGDHEIKVYKTSNGILSELDAKVLDVDIKNTKSTLTDIFAYNYQLEDKKVILKKLEEKIKEIEYGLTGKQTKLKFSQAQDEDLVNKQKELLEKYKSRLLELNLFL